MYSYIQILRPGKSLMSAVFVLIGSVVALGVSGLGSLGDLTVSYGVYLAMLSFFLINGAGNTINDFFDVDSNRMNKPKRPIPSGRVSAHRALLYSGILFVLGILVSASINYLCFIIAVVNSVILILYSKTLHGGILNSVSAGYLTGSAFLFGGAAAGNMSLVFWLFLITAFSTMSRELVKFMEDMEGDRKIILKNIKFRLKRKIAEKFKIGKGGIDPQKMVKRKGALAVLFLILTISLSPMPYANGLAGMVYLIIIFIADIMFLASLYMILMSRGRKQLGRTSNMIKRGRWLVVISFFLSALFFV
jgi:geranylgeranylglycerol-phosphate geranylgeranyltransferase